MALSYFSNLNLRVLLLNVFCFDTEQCVLKLVDLKMRNDKAEYLLLTITG